MQGTRDFALTVAPGQRLPLHAGAAGKVLRAALPRDEIDRVLAAPLVAWTGRTLTGPRHLRAGVSARIARRGWAHDTGEYMPNVNAFAAPIPGRSGHVVAAPSVPYLAGAEPARREQIRVAVITCAAAIAADIPTRAPRARAPDRPGAGPPPGNRHRSRLPAAREPAHRTRLPGRRAHAGGTGRPRRTALTSGLTGVNEADEPRFKAL